MFFRDTAGSPESERQCQLVRSGRQSQRRVRFCFARLSEDKPCNQSGSFYATRRDRSDVRNFEQPTTD